MNQRIDGGMGTNALPQSDESAGAAVQSGSYNGRQVDLKVDTQSMVADMVEELSIEIGEKKAEDKELKKRVAEHGKDRTEEVKKVWDVGKSDGKGIDKDKKGRLKQLLAQLRAAKPKTGGEALSLLENSYDSAPMQHMALEYLLEHLDQEDEDLRPALEEAKSKLYEEHGAEIRANQRNVNAAATHFAEGDDKRVDDLKSLYRDSVLDYDTPAELYGSVIKEFGTEDFPKAIGFLLKAVSTDLNALGRSADGVEMKKLLDDLYSLESLKTIHQQSQSALVRTKKRFSELHVKSTQHLMKALLPAMKQNFPDTRKVEQIAKEMGIKGDDEASIYFLRELTNIVRDIPIKLYANPKHRRNLVQATQNAYQAAVEAE